VPPAEPSAPPFVDILSKALAELGRVAGKDFVVETRWPEGGRLDRIQESAAALVGLKPAVIVAIGATAARAAMAATPDVPIVFVVVVDPVVTGLVASSERPGKNLTGVTSYDAQHSARQIELLREALPGLTRVCAARR
jgi:putative ABC transport system substrate-binding protein